MLKTLFVGKNAFWLEETPSTNLSAYEMLSMNRLPEGSAVLAKYQTKGKGQFGTQWESEHGKNLLVSYVFYPAFLEPKDLFMLNKTIALGVYDYVKQVVKKNVSLKWPNDIYIGDKKIAGILIENSITFSDVNYSIAGVGLNVNQSTFNAFVVPATSFKLITKKNMDLEKCFHTLSGCLQKRYMQLKEKNTDEINSDYKKAMYRFGKLFFYRRKQTTFRARIVDVMSDGKLILRHENGKWESFRFKEIAFVTK
ncbi:MAG TPA: biotin--[acetyl-CoA-carboxylase] ligase [Bacteroidia bacterium]|nr:biotin--[acetyl-CoA-carboxylase] ligase [Bacteroidia bacterium]